jgi:uncharacterized membrane protein
MTSWSAIREGFDAFSRRLPLLLGVWLVVLTVQQIISLLVPRDLLWVEALLLVLILPPLHAGQYRVALKVVRGERCTFSSFGDGIRRWNAVLPAYLMTGVLTGLGLFALIVPGILVALAFSFTLICLLDEDAQGRRLSALEAMTESLHLTRGYRDIVFGIGLLLALPYVFLSVLVFLDTLNPAVPSWILELLALLSGTLFLGPVQATSLAVVYDHARRQRILRNLS